MNNPDQQHILQCINGDMAAWENFIKKYSPVILAIIYKTLNKYSCFWPEEDILDLRQQILLSFMEKEYKKLKQYNGINKCSFSTWLTTVVTRVTINCMKKKGHEANITTTRVNKDEMSNHQNSTEIIRRTDKARLTQNECVDDKREYSDLLEDKQTVEKLTEIIRNELKPREQLYIKLYYEQEKNLDEIAGLMNMNKNALYVLKNRVVKKIHIIFCNNN